MSGGSWDYLYSRVADAASRLAEDGDPKRAILAPHVERLAKALRAIEWVDSGDYGPGDEYAAIDAFLAGLGVNANGCKVGGDPPVPGVGWGLSINGSSRVRWIAEVDTRPKESPCAWVAYMLDGDNLFSTETAALYLPGAPADRPCWRLTADGRLWVVRCANCGAKMHTGTEADALAWVERQPAPEGVGGTCGDGIHGREGYSYGPSAAP